jgi:glycosyltransferase involved in cell wall biosynthesis
MINKIIFNTWPGAFFYPGGGEVQLLNSKLELEKKNYNVEFYDNWNPYFSDEMIYHQFSIEPGTESVMHSYKEKGIKIVLSPIMWNLFQPEHPRFSIVKNMLNSADVLMTNSKAESERLAESFNIPISKFQETRNSVPEAFLNTNTTKNFREEYDIQGDFLLCIANIDTRKNTERLVKACQEIGKQLICIGNIRDKEYFKRFSKLYSRANYLGPVTDKELIKSALQQCELYVLPSLCETPGIAALEALSQGTKVVITEIGATKEYFKDYVTYVDPLSVDSIKKGILLEGNIIRNSAESIQFIRDTYTWDKTAEDIIRGYIAIS